MKLFKSLVAFSLVAVSGVWLGSQLRSSGDVVPSTRGSLSVFSKALDTALYAQSAPTAIGTLRNNIFLIIGYPSDAAYAELNPEGGGPKNGLLGLMGDVFDGVATIAAANGVSTCDQIPATGTLSGNVTILGASVASTVTFSTPGKVVPAGWTNAGTAYTKKISVDAGTTKGSIEFFCDRASAYAQFQIPGDGDGYTGSTRTFNMYFDFEEANASKLEFAMKVVDDNNECGGANTCESWLMRAATGASNQFTLWQSSFAWRGDKFQGERLLINGDYSSQQMSSYYTFESNFGADLTSVTGTEENVADSSPTFDFSPQTTADLSIRGCVDYNTPSEALTANTVCTGFDLAPPDTTIFQNADAANFSYTGLKDLVDNIATF